jgi:signal transduction histidine kinase
LLIDLLRGHCDEFGAQQWIDVTLSATDGLGGVPQEVALCLYRVAQEPLRNIVALRGEKNVSPIVGRHE